MYRFRHKWNMLAELKKTSCKTQFFPAGISLEINSLKYATTCRETLYINSSRCLCSLTLLGISS